MPDAAWLQNIKGIQEICDHASNLDMRIAVENMVNMPAILGRRPEEITGIIETVDRENLASSSTWDMPIPMEMWRIF